MIIERNEFCLKFGKAKPAIELWKQILNEMKNQKNVPKIRILTDLTGPSYTLVLELELRNLLDFAHKNYQWMISDKIRELYEEFKPLCDSAHRTLYKLEYEM
jgi:hypothetical protein